MSIITFFSGSYCSEGCNEGAVLDKLVQKTGYSVIDDRMIVAEASRASGLSEKKIQGLFQPKHPFLTSSPMRKNAPSPT
jgi:hypothetical protein